MLSSYLNKTDFYSYAGITSTDVNDAYVTFVISRVNAMISQKLTQLFTLTHGYTYKYYPKNSKVVCPIEHWQDAGVVDRITITSGGTGYTSAPTVVFSGGTATAVATIASGAITSIDITYQGKPKEYTSAPAISFTGGAGSGAVATCTISSLLIQRCTDDSTNPTITDLVEGSDYRLLYSEDNRPDRTYPVVAVELYFVPLWFKQYLQVTGTYGYSPYIPAELGLDMEFYEMLKELILRADADTANGGRGRVVSTRIDKVAISFEHKSDITMRDLLNDMQYRLDAILADYNVNSSLYLPSIVG